MAALSDVPKDLRPTVACMIRALRLEPHIDRLNAGAVMSSGWSSPRAYVEYRTVGRAKDLETIRFVSAETANGPEFSTGLFGVFAPPDKGPDDYRTGRVAQIWKTRCGVNAWALYN